MDILTLINPLIKGLLKDIRRNQISKVAFQFEVTDKDFFISKVLYLDAENAQKSCTLDEFKELLKKP